MQNAERQLKERDLEHYKLALKEKVALQAELASNQESVQRVKRKLAEIDAELGPVQSSLEHVAKRLAERIEIDKELRMFSSHSYICYSPRRHKRNRTEFA